MKLIHPNSKSIIIWESFILLLAVLETIFSPLYIIFSFSPSVTFFYFEIFITVFFALDIFIRFRTDYLVYHELTGDRKAIAARYLKGWFFIDLLAALPFFLLRELPLLAGMLVFHRFSRLIRLLKLFSSAKTLKRAQKLAFLNPAYIRLFLLIFWVLLAAHLISSGWIFIGGSHLYEKPLHSYIEAFYWTISTLTTIGYGDITPSGPAQMTFVIIVAMIGAAIYGFIIANIANIIAKIDVTKSHFKEKVENVNTFLKYQNIPQSLQKKIQNYYEYSWETRRGYEESTMLAELPTSLKTEISFFLNKEIIKKVPLFHEASQEFIRDIVLNLKPVIYTPGDAIITQGEIDYDMYFISQGTVDVTNAEGSVIYDTLSAGSFFGEMALLLSTPRTATVRARGYCDVYILSKDTFYKVLHRYPLFAKNVKELIQQRRKNMGLAKGEKEALEMPEELLSPPPKEAVPKSIIHQLLDNAALKLSWIPVSGAESYEVARKNPGEEGWKILSSTVTTLSFLDTRPLSGESVYKIRAKTWQGMGPWSESYVVRLA